MRIAKPNVHLNIVTGQISLNELDGPAEGRVMFSFNLRNALDDIITSNESFKNLCTARDKSQSEIEDVMEEKARKFTDEVADGLIERIKDAEDAELATETLIALKEKMVYITKETMVNVWEMFQNFRDLKKEIDKED